MTISIDSIYQDWYNFLIGEAKKVVLVKEDAEDMVHDAIISFSRADTSQLKDIEEVRCYLLKAIRNKCLNLVKHKSIKYSVHKNIARASKEEDTTEDQIMDKITRKVILRRVIDLIPSLSKQQQQIFVMVHSRNMNLREVANALGIKYISARVQYARCVDFMVKNIRGKKKAAE